MKTDSLSKYFGVKPSHRVAILGKTGSGKTVLAKRMCLEFNSVLILDFKHTIRIPGVEITSDPKRLTRLGMDFPQIIFRIPRDWKSPQLDNLFKWAFERENTLVYIDEGYSVGSNSSYPHWLQIVAVQGRETNVALWSLFQRPRRVPTFLVSEAEHFFVFYLSRQEDRDYIDEMAETEINWKQIAPRYNEETGEVENSFMFYHVRVGASVKGPYKIREVQNDATPTPAPTRIS